MANRAGWRARKGLGATGWAAILAVIVAFGVASVFLVETGGGVQRTTRTSVTSSYSTSTGGNPSSLNGLRLSLVLNGSEIASGQGIAATVDDVNTMTTPLNMSAAANWPVGDLAVGPCGTLNYPVGIAVLRGDYDLSNVSSANALQIYQPGAYPCPAILSGIRGYVFQPSSDNTTIFGTCEPGGACFSERVDTTVAFKGYWSGGAFASFPTGVYTVVAGDEWGDISILHFVVMAGGA